VRLTDRHCHCAALLAALLAAGILKAAPSPSPEASPSQLHGKKIDLPVPVGEPVKGIKIPQYDEQGNLTMSLSAESARKLDENRVELGKLRVQFDDKAEKEIVVEIPHSFLDLETKMLVADSETLISREDFEIVGQGAEFDTAARKGVFKGHVRASFRNEKPILTP